MRLFAPLTAVLICCCLSACSKPDASDQEAQATTASDTAVITEPGSNVPPPQAIPNSDPVSENPIAGQLQGAFKANGVSPSWTAMAADEALQFQVTDAAGAAQAAKSISVQRALYDAGVNYSGMDGAATVSLDVRHTPCVLPNQADKPRAYTATLTHGESIYRGCADAL